MTQDQIKLKNILYALQETEYKKYDYKSIGMVIHYLKAYGFMDYDVCTIGDGQINHHGEVMAQFKWDSDLRLPIFTFSKKYDFINSVQQIYLRSEEILSLKKTKNLTVDEALEKYIKEKYDKSMYQVLSIGMDDVKEFAEYYATLKNK